MTADGHGRQTALPVTVADVRFAFAALLLKEKSCFCAAAAALLLHCSLLLPLQTCGRLKRYRQVQHQLTVTAAKRRYR